MTVRIVVAAMAALGSFATIAAPAAAGALRIEGAYVPAPPPGAPAALYATLRNHGERPVTVVGAEVDGFADAMLHASVHADGVVRMSHAGAITVLPGKTSVLEPHGDHLMLMGPQRLLNTGATVSGRFTLEGGGTVPFEAVVVAPGGAAGGRGDAGS